MASLKMIMRLFASYMVYKIATFLKKLMMMRRGRLRGEKFFLTPTSNKHWLWGYLDAVFKREKIEGGAHVRKSFFDEVTNAAGTWQGSFLLGPPVIFSEHLIVYTRDPEMVKLVLHDEFDSFVKPGAFKHFMNPLLGDGIFNISHGTTSKMNGKWSFQRKTASKIFTRKIFNNHVHDVLAKNLSKLDDIFAEAIRKNEGNIKLKNICYCFTMDTIGDIGFGMDLDTLGSREIVPFSKAFDRGLANIFARFQKPFWEIFGFLVYQSEADLSVDLKTIDNFVRSLVETRTKDKSYEEKGDILSLFLQADGTLSYQTLKDVIISFILAGRDTTACTMSFVFFLLATHPEVQEKLLGEMQSCKDPTFDNLKQMHFLNAVIYETLRLFPPVPLNSKETGREITLPCGLTLPPESTVSYITFSMNRDETRYENAGTFNPERWLMDGEFKEPNPYEFPVFQAGPRICIGKDLALFESRFMLFKMINKYRIEYKGFQELSPSDKADFYADVGLLQKKPVYINSVTLSFNGDLDLILHER